MSRVRMNPAEFRTRWLSYHSASTVLLALAVAVARRGESVAISLFLAQQIVSFALLAVFGRHGALRSADWVTAVRLLAVVLVYSGALAISIAGASAAQSLLVALALFLGGAELSDFFDGLLARLRGPSEFGAFWDAEIDAAFMLALSVGLILYYEAPLWVASAGLFRYVFFFLFLLLAELRRPPLAFRWFAKSACAVAAVLLVVAYIPQLGHSVRFALGVGAVVLLGISFAWETVLRIREVRRSKTGLGETFGLLHSMAVYYGVPFRKRRMRQMYGQFVTAGSVVFDIGSHVGNRLWAFDSLGCRTVAVEPNPSCVALLRRFYGNRTSVDIVAKAVGGAAGSGTLHISTLHPTLATVSSGWIDRVGRNSLFRGIEWNKTVEVPVTTLDELIAVHGIPDFIKIDVEGMEAEVLSGLSMPVRALSFEFLPADISPSVASVELTRELGAYEFNYSMVETMRFALPEWVGPEEMVEILKRMPAGGRSGDVYARSIAETK